MCISVSVFSKSIFSESVFSEPYFLMCIGEEFIELFATKLYLAIAITAVKKILSGGREEGVCLSI